MAGDSHPLHNTWTLWYDSKSGKPAATEGGDWEKSLVSVATVKTVEDFWITQNHVKKPSSIDFNANYHFFRNGVKPMWEDASNTNGGKWAIQLTGKEEMFRIDAMWEELLLSIIGEYLDPANEVIGAVLGKRKNAIRLAVWTRNKDDAEANMKVGNNLRKELRLPLTITMDFFPHNNNNEQGFPVSTLKA